MQIHKTVFIAILIIIGGSGYAQIVNNVTELNSAINSASPGSTVVLADGTWDDVFIDIDKNGSSTQPITITAQNPGNVLMTGNSRVYMEGSYLTLSGLVFEDADDLVTSGSNIEPVIELKDCDNCRVISNKIYAYNGTEAQKSMKFKWVLNDGQNNEIAYNSFIGKYGVGSIINDNRNTTTPDYLKIHHNVFADRTPINGLNDDNDQDAIRIGQSNTSLDDSFTEVYDNYFYNFFGEIEVISNKSGQNKYYNNTFRNYSGALTLRHGDNCEVYGNYFFAEDNFQSGGVRVIGEGHKIYNNYISGVNSTKPSGSLSDGTGGINVTNGRLDTELNGYYQVKNTAIVNNTFVNCDYALRIGTMISSDLELEPENLVVANNITYNSSIEDYQITTEPSGNSVSEGNILDLPMDEMTDDGDLYRINAGSSPIDASIGDYSYVTRDVLQGIRDGGTDAGAEEFGANGEKLPYTEADVEVNVGFGSDSNSITPSSSTIDFGVCGSTVSFEIISNVNWEISENLDWLELDISSGSGTQMVTAVATENTSGGEKLGEISINEVAGGDDLEATISVVQLTTSVDFEIQIIGSTSLGMQDKDEIAEINAYNDDLSNYWTGDPSEEPEVSITFDLGDIYFLTRAGINFWNADERTTTFSLAVAEEEAGPFTTVQDFIESADSGVTVASEQLFGLGGLEGRYVKFTGHGNSSSSSWTSIANVNVYGDVNCENASSSTSDLTEENFPIKLFPVPAKNGYLQVSSTKEINHIEIYNAMGQLVLISDGNGLLYKKIDISTLNSGVYFMKSQGHRLTQYVVN